MVRIKIFRTKRRLILHTLRSLREKRGFTLEALAFVSGIDQATISRIERGVSNPRDQTVVRLARALGISIALFRRMVDAGPDRPAP